MNNHHDGLEVEDEEDEFFESLDRMSSAVSFNVCGSSGSEDDAEEDFDESRMSFASAVGPPANFFHPRRSVAMSELDADFLPRKSVAVSEFEADFQSGMEMEDYDIWMSEPMSIEERRRRLLRGMGFCSRRELNRINSNGVCKTASSKEGETSPAQESPLGVVEAKGNSGSPSSSDSVIVIYRSRSMSSIAEENVRCRREEFLGNSLPPVLSRNNSAPLSLCSCQHLVRNRRAASFSRSRTRSVDVSKRRDMSMLSSPSTGEGAFICKIKDLDTGKEFVVLEDGTWNQLSEVDTGRQLTIEEFEKCVGYSPIVKELMRRENIGLDDKINDQNGNPPLAKTASKGSKRRVGTGWLKNIKGVANSVTTGRLLGERENWMMDRSSSRSSSSSEWMKVRQHGKSYKELTGLYMCQEIQAHQGSIWSIKFNHDARYLASAGEDRVIHVWEVNEREPPSLSAYGQKIEECCNSSSFQCPSSMGSRSLDHRPPLAESHSERKRRGKISSGSRKGSTSDYIAMPETIFSLSEKPVCSFEGHLDDVLDLSWSKSQHLLSSSMDKTVRLWDMESQACLKLFAHNDYVTCIQFNPTDDNYFISGSLDAKVRIWSIPDRQVVDWNDLHEMVTAACYTPDGQGALVGSHKGSCRLYNTTECKLHLKAQVELQSKKKKSHAKKITGFQFAPGNPSEVLVTSADSQIRVFSGVDLIHKFKGFRNTNSQISASFTPDGRYVVCASEDSQVFIWKREELRSMAGGAKRVTTRSHEHFQCKDVSVAIPWPGSIKYEQPPLPSQSRRYSQGHQRQPSLRCPVLPHESPCRKDAFMSSRRNNSGRRHLPPLPKKSFSERTWPEEELSANPLRSDSGVDGASFISASPSRSEDSSFLSSSAASSRSSWRWYDSSIGNSSIHATTAWGLVVVTAGLGGEIRAYQNFGLPVRVGRQANLFGGQSPL